VQKLYETILYYQCGILPCCVLAVKGLEPKLHFSQRICAKARSKLTGHPGRK
jgi:hypothetical protein